jgi:hypothetical protein
MTAKLLPPQVISDPKKKLIYSSTWELRHKFQARETHPTSKKKKFNVANKHFLRLCKAT